LTTGPRRGGRKNNRLGLGGKRGGVLSKKVSHWYGGNKKRGAVTDLGDNRGKGKKMGDKTHPFAQSTYGFGVQTSQKGSTKKLSSG